MWKGWVDTNKHEIIFYMYNLLWRTVIIIIIIIIIIIMNLFINLFILIYGKEI